MVGHLDVIGHRLSSLWWDGPAGSVIALFGYKELRSHHWSRPNLPAAKIAVWAFRGSSLVEAKERAAGLDFFVEVLLHDANRFIGAAEIADTSSKRTEVFASVRLTAHTSISQDVTAHFSRIDVARPGEFRAPPPLVTLFETMLRLEFLDHWSLRFLRRLPASRLDEVGDRIRHAAPGRRGFGVLLGPFTAHA